MTAEDAAAGGRRSKVQRLIEEYGLEGLGAELERAWTAEDPDERRSLRDLATYFNQQLLEQALRDAGATVLDGEVENTYRLLTDDDVSTGDRTRTERQLEREDIDVDKLRSDFLSYQAIRTYLKKHRDAEHTTADRDRGASAIETVQRLRSRLITVAENRLEGLRSAGELTLGEFRVILDLRVVCEECGTQQDFVTLVEDGGCECSN
ncbi:rod-determining factor RdfA [Haloglomus halophilum]|uniref:rod-determining factor RdfA n=1 Tax=Haloglomus halophilum TaxID=2962672 RepID=UPI0020C99DC0|nr:rod-determining factor RdfA [Haloglomus halophilum]